MSVSGITITISGADVRAIIDTGLADAAVTVALDAATILVRDHAEIAALPADTVDAIIRYLAAHFITVQSPRVASRGLGRANESYQGQTQMNLKSSFYGQTAMMLDSTGTLQTLDASSATVSLDYLGGDISGADYP